MKQFFQWLIAGSLVVLVVGVIFINRKTDTSKSASQSPMEASMSRSEVARTSTAVEANTMPTDNNSVQSAAVADSPVASLANANDNRQKLPFELRSIMDSDRSYKERLELLHALDWNTLQPEVIEAIADWLLDTDASIENPMEELAIRNDLLEGLIAQPQWADVSGRLLISGVRDHDQHPLWREYMMQYYSIFIQDYFGAPGVDPVLFDELKATLVSALGEDTNGMAGTALLNINRLKQDTPAIVEGLEWEAPTIVLALNREANMASRIPALQILPVVEPGIDVGALQTVIESADEHTLVKLAAVNFARRACMAGHGEFLSVVMAARQQPSRVLSETSLFNY